MKRELQIIFLFLCLFNQVYAKGDSKYFRKLDSLIFNKESLESIREGKIFELHKRLKKAKTDKEKFDINNLLFEAYYINNADSAMNYLDKNFVIAQNNGDNDLINSIKIKKSFIFTASGLLNEALETLNDIDSSQLPHFLKKDYYGQLIYLYGLLGNYASSTSSDRGWNHYFEIEQNYKDSLLSILSPDDEGFLWYKGWSAQGLPKEQQDSVMNMLAEAVDNSQLNSREDAQIAYVLAILYKEQGRKDKYLEYMIKSAITDVKIGNREIASLQELAKNRFESGDIDRAYEYISYCLDAALQYPNRVRSLSLLPIQNEINNAYQEKSRHQDQITRGFIIALCLLATVLTGAIILIFVQMKKLKYRNHEATEANILLHSKNRQLEEAQNQLAETNGKLKELNIKLQEANENLRDVNYVKEEYVGYVFYICSHYIKKMEDLRRLINIKAKKKLWKDIEDLTSNHQLMAKEELKEFYDNFDSIFLHIFPDFVNDFNSLLLPEEKIVLKEGEKLNTDLRIYALIRLGISDSVKISEFLHCSTQTVYNYRFKTRNKACIPKDQFAEAVKNLGKVEIQ